MKALGQNGWPEAPTEAWLETCATLHMWSQIVGKVRLARSPMLNHWWQATLHLTARGLTTGVMPDGARGFQIDFDLLAHRLLITTGDGGREEMLLTSLPLPEFYADFFARLGKLGIDVRIWPRPVELPEATPFTEDTRRYEYRPEVAERLLAVLHVAESSLARFRDDFLGKCSPVHFFWGSFDLAVTRFSGRRAPEHPGGVPNLADWVTREAYSHEVASAGFWPGTRGGFERPAFYAYAYPAPPGYEAAKVRPTQAVFSTALREFLLPYHDIRALSDPAASVQDFLQSTYAAAADLSGWDRAGLERRPKPQT